MRAARGDVTAAPVTLTGKRIYYLTDAKVAELLNIPAKRVKDLPISSYCFLGHVRYSSVDLAEYVVACKVPAKPARVNLAGRPKLSLVSDDDGDDSAPTTDAPTPAA